MATVTIRQAGDRLSTSATWQGAGGQIQGGRAEQQDDFACVALAGTGRNAPSIVALVADGMGGHAGGELASRVAISTAVSALAEARGMKTGAIDLGGMIEAANDRIKAEAAGDASRQGMGTTFVAVELSDHGVRWASVGDSLLLVVSSGGVRRLNADHSMAPTLDDMAERGELSAEEARNSPSRNKLRSVLRGDEIPLLDVSSAWTALAPTDVVIVASDGLLSLPMSRIGEIAARATTPSDCVEALLEAVEAIRAPQQDNTSVVVAMRSRRRNDAAQTPPPAHRSRSIKVLKIGLAAAAALAVAAVATTVAVHLLGQNDKPPIQPGDTIPATETTDTGLQGNIPRTTLFGSRPNDIPSPEGAPAPASGGTKTGRVAPSVTRVPSPTPGQVAPPAPSSTPPDSPELDTSPTPSPENIPGEGLDRPAQVLEATPTPADESPNEPSPSKTTVEPEEGGTQ